RAGLAPRLARWSAVIPCSSNASVFNDRRPNLPPLTIGSSTCSLGDAEEIRVPVGTHYGFSQAIAGGSDVFWLRLKLGNPPVPLVAEHPNKQHQEVAHDQQNHQADNRDLRDDQGVVHSFLM